MNTARIDPNSTKQESLIVAGAEVHLWRVLLDEAYDPAHERLLAPDELARAHRYLSPLVRQRFIASRGTLRTILATYLDIEPGGVSFQYSRHGKPALAGLDHSLRFNVSHSENFLLIAVSWERNLGVDVEYVRAMPEADTIAAQYFSSAEYDRYRSLSDNIKPQAFFNCWTRKEAYIKACGDGFAIPFSSFEVSFLPGEPACVLRPSDKDSRSWHMHAFSAAPGLIAALVVCGGVEKPRSR